MIVLFLLGMLLVSPLVLAQEQDQIYSGFDRFKDNVILFFSGGDNKVKLALEIKEKEIYSAMKNVQDGNEINADENLERAWKRLQLVQEKVSINTAEEVRESSNEVRETIMNREDLPNDFEVYALEEEKTGLTAEWVIEVNGKEGQTLTGEIVVDEEQDRVVDIEKRIIDIDNEISNWVVENDIAGGSNVLVPVIKTEIAMGDNGLKPEVKTSVNVDGTERNDPLPEPDLNRINPDLYDPNARAPGDTIDETYDDNEITNNIDGGTGTEGVNEAPSPAVDSNEGDSSDPGSDDGDSGGDSAPITGEIIKDSDSRNFISKLFGWLF